MDSDEQRLLYSLFATLRVTEGDWCVTLPKLGEVRVRVDPKLDELIVENEGDEEHELARFCLTIKRKETA